MGLTPGCFFFFFVKPATTQYRTLTDTFAREQEATSATKDSGVWKDNIGNVMKQGAYDYNNDDDDDDDDER